MRTFGWAPTEEELKEMVNVIDQVGINSLLPSRIQNLESAIGLKPLAMLDIYTLARMVMETSVSMSLSG